MKKYIKCPSCNEIEEIQLNEHPRYCKKCKEKFNKFYSTKEKIEILFNNFSEFLKEKNKRYGDSVLKPLNVFSKDNSSSQICNRIDDKLGRIKNSNELKKNDVSDMFGYIALLLIENDWLEFNDLLD